MNFSSLLNENASVKSVVDSTSRQAPYTCRSPILVKSPSFLNVRCTLIHGQDHLNVQIKHALLFGVMVYNNQTSPT